MNVTDQQDPLDFIKNMLESKSDAKQRTYKHLLASFDAFRQEAKNIALELTKKVRPNDKEVTVEFSDVNQHEFQLKLAGDLLIFVLHTNVVTFQAEHPVMQDAHISENEVNRYFGQINIYNFMSDSLKFNRVNDPGYLVARIMINHENKYFIEGEGPLHPLSNKLSETAISREYLRLLIKLTLTIAIENDLTAPAYEAVKFITLYQKLEHTPALGGGQKIGFKMNHERQQPH
jgi:hypothetical protein